MFGNMPTNVGTYAIHIFGDVGFMEEVLLALSALKQSGYFAAAGGIGALIALLITMFQGAAKGGRDLDLGGWFVTVLLFVGIFGPGATVQINHVRPIPSQPAVEIPNIPLGIAMTASIVTSIGKRVTIATETAFADVNGPASIANGGPGRALKWLASIRMLSDPDHSSPYLQNLRTSIQNYMEQCSTTAFQLQPERRATAPLADILDPVNGYALNSHSVFVNWIEPGTGARSTITCLAATNNLNAVRNNPTLLQEHVAISEPKVSDWRSMSPAADFGSMMGTLGIAAIDAQRYMFASVTRGVFHSTSLRDQGGASTAEQALWAMTIQSTEKSASDFAGQEVAFLQALPSLISFMESLIFCATPFMAFVMMVGRAGFQSFLKLLFIPAYIAAWFPTMAVINAFSVHRVTNAINDMSAQMVSTGSIQASWEITQQALSALSTSSMLMASTPVIALFLLSGGAYVTAQLANTLKGVDKNGEKTASPDAIDVGAARKVETPGIYNDLAGTKGNVAQPTMNSVSSGAVESSRAWQAISEQSSNWARNATSTLEQTRASNSERISALSNADRSELSQVLSDGLQANGSERASFGSLDSVGQSAAVSNLFANAAGVNGAVRGDQLIRAAQGIASELTGHSMWKDMKADLDSGKMGKKGFMDKATSILGAAGMALTPTTRGGRLGLLALEGMGGMIGAHGSAAVTDSQNISQMASSVEHGANLVESTLARTNNAEARAATTNAKAAELLQRKGNSSGARSMNAATYSNIAQEGERRMESDSAQRRELSQGGMGYARQAPEIANQIAEMAAGGNVAAGALLAATRDLPSGVGAGLQEKAAMLDPDSAKGNDPASERKREALKAVIAVMGLGGARNPDKWQNSGGPEAMQSRLSELGGLYLDTQTGGGFMSPGQAEAQKISQGPGYAQEATAANPTIAGKGETRAAVAKASTPVDEEAVVKGTPGSQPFDQEGFNAVQKGVADANSGSSAAAPRANTANQKFVLNKSDQNREAVGEPSQEGKAAQALAKFGQEGETNEQRELGGENGVGTDASSRTQGQGGTSLKDVADAIYLEGSGSSSHAPTRQAAVALAGALIENSGVGGLNESDAQTVREAAQGLSQSEAKWVSNAMGSDKGQSATTMPGVEPSADSSAIPGMVAAFMANPSQIPALLSMAQGVAGDKALDRNDGLDQNVKTTKSNTYQYTDRQVEGALNALNANGKLPEEVIEAGKAFSEDDEGN